MLVAAAGLVGRGECAVGAAQGTQSPQQLKGLSLEELGNVQVTTYNKEPSALIKTPAAIYVISGDDILRSGATNIADALRLAPGVEVGRISSTTWAVGIRGLQGNFSKSVLVLIDGRSVYTPLFAGVYWDVQDLPLEDIDRIEVIRGPGGTIWGPNASNGVINIITKKSTETTGVTVHALAGSSDHTIDDLQVGAANHKQLSFRLFGRGFERAHEYHTDGINEDAWHQERVGFRADLVAGRDQYMAEGDAYRGDSPHIIGTTPIYDETSGGDINVRWERRLSDSSGFYLQAYFDRSLRTDPASLGEARNTIDIDFIHHFKLPGKQQFTYGGGLRWSPYEIHSPSPFEALIPAKATDHVHTGFVQDEIELGSEVKLTFGAKLQHNNFSGFDVQPSARLLWSHGEKQALWVGISGADTTPSDLEEDFLLEGPAGPKTIIEVLGNKQAKSEDLTGYELGYRRLLGKTFFVDVATFWNEYTNLQSFSAPMISSSGGNTYIAIQYTNQIAGHTSGFEVSPRMDLRPWWHVNWNYSFVSSNFGADGATSDISGTGSVPTYEKSTPKHLVFVQSKLDLPGKIQFDQTYRFASDLPAQKVEAYQTMDVRAAKSLGTTMLLEVVGQNLFQPHHVEWGTGDPTQPVVGINRAVYVKLSFHAGSRPTH
ncbi:MAG: TonB-dependent receptor [Acidobacteriota bacterium]